MNDLAEYNALVEKEADLLQRREELADELAPLKKQKAEAVGRARQRRQYSDPQWFSTLISKIDFLESEIRKINIETMRTQRRLGELRREKAIQRDIQLRIQERNDPTRKTKHQLFIQVAKEILPENQFQRIWQVVEGRLMAARELAPEEHVQEIEVNGNR